MGRSSALAPPQWGARAQRGPDPRLRTHSTRKQKQHCVQPAPRQSEPPGQYGSLRGQETERPRKAHSAPPHRPFPGPASWLGPCWHQAHLVRLQPLARGPGPRTHDCQALDTRAAGGRKGRWAWKALGPWGARGVSGGRACPHVAPSRTTAQQTSGRCSSGTILLSPEPRDFMGQLPMELGPSTLPAPHGPNCPLPERSEGHRRASRRGQRSLSQETGLGEPGTWVGGTCRCSRPAGRGHKQGAPGARGGWRPQARAAQCLQIPCGQSESEQRQVQVSSVLFPPWGPCDWLKMSSP